MGLADLCEKIGLTLADAVAAGDSANDVGMLKAAGLGCCMSNGTPDAKAAADRVIGDVREDGLAAPSSRSCGSTAPRRNPPAGTSAPRGARWKKGGRVRMSFAPVYDVRSRLEHGPARKAAKPALCRRRKGQGR